MFDVVHPKVSLPDDGALRAALERGQMVLDVLDRPQGCRSRMRARA